MRFLKIFLFNFLIFHTCTFNCNAQDSGRDTLPSKILHRAFGIDFGYEYQQTHGVYLGANYLFALNSTQRDTGIINNFIGPSLGVSLDFKDRIFYGQRFGLNCYHVFPKSFGINGGLFAENFNTQDFTYNDFRLGVTGGISAAAILNINYSYSQSFTDNRLSGKHKISLILNLNFLTFSSALRRRGYTIFPPF